MMTSSSGKTDFMTKPDKKVNKKLYFLVILVRITRDKSINYVIIINVIVIFDKF